MILAVEASGTSIWIRWMIDFVLKFAAGFSVKFFWDLYMKIKRGKTPFIYATKGPGTIRLESQFADSKTGQSAVTAVTRAVASSQPEMQFPRSEGTGGTGGEPEDSTQELSRSTINAGEDG